MKIEQTADLERRAATHAALADPARLMIIDSLTLGDASPSQLQTALGMTSNLLAHHLKVLHDAGLLRRTRSEADRRRAYLQLIPAALDAVTPGTARTTARTTARVLFVCTANTARSQLAAALWRRSSAIPVTSAGTHPAARVDPGAVAVAHRHQLPMARRRPRALDDVREDDDLVITVCDNAHEELSDVLGPTSLHWSIPDPVRIGTTTAFDVAYRELTQRVHDLAPRLTQADRSTP